MSEGFSGGCLCGAVKYQASSDAPIQGDCYCEDCRRSSGTTHCTHMGLPETAVTVTGDLTFFDKAADSGNVVSRGFCPTCGSAVYSTNSAMPGMIFIRGSSCDEVEKIRPRMTVYASRAPSWAPINRDNPIFDEMPPQTGEMMEKAVSGG